jgi:hypothetical protein
LNIWPKNPSLFLTESTKIRTDTAEINPNELIQLSDMYVTKMNRTGKNKAVNAP